MNSISSRVRRPSRSLHKRDTRLVELINQASCDWERETDQGLCQRFQQLKLEHDSTDLDGPVNDSTLVVAFGLAKEALRRTVSMSAYDVQVLAGIAMARGSIAEMQTGEGKTLTSVFPIVAHAILGSGVHVATVNAYLAERDFEFVRPALAMLGLTAGLSKSGDAAEQKRAAYQCDVTFATGYELGFDFLRDQIALRERGADRLGQKLRRELSGATNRPAMKMQRGFAAAIIDEIDSVLIDEATTPLVLSSGQLGMKVDESVYLAANDVATELNRDEDFEHDVSKKSLALTQRGSDRAHQLREQCLAIETRAATCLLRPWRLYVESALRAQHVMIRDINYVVREETVEIVDEYTGRIFADRNWRDGLHQAVEAKEGLPISEERKTIARISRQRYFQRYEILCGMTGTADGNQRELTACYGLPITIIPRRKPLVRKLLPTRYFDTQENKVKAIVNEVQIRNATGQPVLVGTRTIQQSLRLANELSLFEIKHRVLNGVQDEDESSLIAVAGAQGAVTVATNMAGRGTDIKPDADALAVGGLHVIGFERNSSVRIDRQLLGRAGRQGDPGSGQFFVSAEDDLVIRFDPGLAKQLRRISNAKGIISRNFDRRVEQIQQAAEKESCQTRRDVMRDELWLDKVKKSAG